MKFEVWNRIWKGVFIRILILLALSLVGYLLLCLVYCIPTDQNSNIYNNVKSSLTYFETDFSDHNYMEVNSEVNLFSDALYFLEASDKGTGNPFLDSIKNVFQDIAPIRQPLVSYHLLYADNSDTDSMVNKNFNLYLHNHYYYMDIVKDDNRNVTINDFSPSDYIYGRYWNGYLILLKPLLYFFNYAEIRLIMTMVLLCLFVALIIVTYKECKPLVIGELCLFIFLQPASLFLCFMYFCITVLIMLFLILIIRFKEFFLSQKRNACLVFFVVGFLSYYLDIMTFPFLTLLLPLSLLMFFVFYNNSKTNQCIKYGLCMCLKYGVNWICGFALSLGIKLILLFIVAGQEQIDFAIFLIKTWSTLPQVNYFSTIFIVFKTGLQPLLVLFMLVLLIYTIIVNIKNKNFYLGPLLITCLISLTPLLVILVIQTHSNFHSLYSFREFAVTWFAVINYCLYCLTQNSKKCRFLNLSWFNVQLKSV